MNKIQEVTSKLSQPANRYLHESQDELTPDSVKNLLQEVFQQISSALDLNECEAAIMHWNEAKAHIRTHFELAYLAFHRFTDDPAVEAEHKRLLEEIEPVEEEWNAKIREKLLGHPQREAIEKKFGSFYFLQLKILQDSFHPKNIEIETRLNDVLAEYTKILGGAQFEVDGEKYPLAHFRKFSVSPKKEIRQKSCQSYAGWFLDHKEKLEAIYEKAITMRTEMGKNLGFDNFIPLAYQEMHRTDYTPTDVAAFRQEILQVIVPQAEKIRAWQAKELGGSKTYIWDIDYFPSWQLGPPKVPIAKQLEVGTKVFKKLSPKLGEHFEKMVEMNLIDVPARDGKAPGAFCMEIPDYRVPYLFLNSIGEASDVSTLLHESGHGFQVWESRGIELRELTHPTLDACEVHSMGMELLAFPYYEEFLEPKDAELYRKRHLADSILILPYIAMVDEFQHLVYSGQASGVKGREEAWEELEKKYMPGVDYGDLGAWRRARWIRQIHIFEVPFYYIDYAIAQVGAWQLWVQSLKDQKAAIENYLQLCQLGGTVPLKQFFTSGNLHLPFEPGFLRGISEEIIKHIGI